jgi:hypothetical protein
MNKISVWQIEKLYYVWYEDAKRYFIYCYKYKNMAFIAANNLSRGSICPENQLVKEEDYKCCVYVDRRR